MWRNFVSNIHPFHPFVLSLSKHFVKHESPSTSSGRTMGLFAALIFILSNTAQAQLPNIGREATPAEIAAWNIDVRSDFKGLPKGAGTVAKGNDIWDAQCASCHGTFGESNQVFPPLVGGTTKDDMAKGRAAGMIDGKSPYRTTLMKTSQISTVWDYINRAMPWTAPKSLSTDEVYAVTAYLLNLGGIVPDDFTLSDKNIAQVQATMPNRNGKTQNHGMWHVNGKGDTHNTACVKNCGNAKVTSTMPDYARNAHGNLAEQNRTYGPYRGINTTLASSSAKVVASPAAAAAVAPAVPATAVQTAPLAPAPAQAVSAPAKPEVDVKPLLSKYTCTACHGMNNKIVGPAFADIAKKQAGKVDYLAGKIKAGGQGVWGAIPMPAQAIPASDALLIAQWLSKGAK